MSIINRCYLCSDFDIFDSEIVNYLAKDGIYWPENGRNATQIKEWVAKLNVSPKSFTTSSLYLLRELIMQNIPIIYTNLCLVNGVKTIMEDSDINRIGDIEILDRDLIQSDEYLNYEYKQCK